MKFNEDSRVKIPTLLHLVRLGYKYLSIKKNNFKIDKDTNIFKEIFFKSIHRINDNLNDSDIEKLLSKISLTLENKDLGRVFYENLVNQSSIKLIDFENFENNSFNVVTELTYKKDDEEFRPDITILINGMPLIFIEVKKPNNREGVLAEQKRLKTRFKNNKFIKFINLTQYMIFSNNMEYDDESNTTLEGAFYASPSYKDPVFNYFREEHDFGEEEDFLSKLSEEQEKFILKDNNLVSISDSDEYKTNKNFNTPTNRICTSLLKKDRLSFILEFGLAYSENNNIITKQIMRYPQLFATKAIEKILDQNKRKGIIWHTQGSGKTALAFYNVKHLTKYFQKQKKIVKFYFIVDRLDLLTQASREFRARGLSVQNIDSRDDFVKDIKSNKAINNDLGKSEITVVNIQKFKDDPNVLENNDYQIDIQRIYFLDEVHRSYNPKGSFLANLEESDRNSLKIGLTGTPLLGENSSRSLFGDYIHKYYYNMSIKDGYTLRLIREEIDTNYAVTLKKTLEEIKVLKGGTDKRFVYSHDKFVEPMLEYILNDYENGKISMNCDDLGGMIVCDSSEQAKKMFEIFQKKYSNKSDDCNLKVALILHDVGDKKERKILVEQFKDGQIDLLIVYNMLLTGFDAPRLKKLYLGRTIKAHNLLQTLTRVNRRYQDFKYGYVVDFANIQKEFEKTNRDYMNELQSTLGEDFETYSNIFKSTNEINKEIDDIKNILFHFNIQNAEIFSQQISKIDNREEILKITAALNNSKNLYNIIRLKGDYELLDKIDFKMFNILSKEANNRLLLINTKEALENKFDNENLLNLALEDVIFAFIKIKEEEMLLADELKSILQKTRENLGGNFDQTDPEFISLKNELQRLFDKKSLKEVSREEIEKNISKLSEINLKAKEINRKNDLLKAKYDNDEKYAKLHKRLMEKDPLTDNEEKLFRALNSLKQSIDEQILLNTKIMDNEEFVEKMTMKHVINEIQNNHKILLSAPSIKRINGIIIKEYIKEFKGIAA
jgi:type I restriction enzyme R subunit